MLSPSSDEFMTGNCRMAFTAACRTGRSGRRRCRTRAVLLDVSDDVVLRDAAAEAGSGDAAEIHVVITRDAAHERARADAMPILVAIRRRELDDGVFVLGDSL